MGSESRPKNAAAPAAYVAGASALLLARWPVLAPSHVKEILIRSGKPGEPTVPRMGDMQQKEHHDSFLNITKALKFAAQVVQELPAIDGMCLGCTDGMCKDGMCKP